MKKILTRAVLAALVTLSATGAQAASIEVTKESSSLIKIDNSVKYKASQATSNGKVTVSKEAGNDLSGTESVQPIFIRTLAVRPVMRGIGYRGRRPYIYPFKRISDGKFKYYQYKK